MHFKLFEYNNKEKITGYTKKNKSDYTNQFTKMIANNIRFSFCCDEWTSLDNKRYFNLTLFTSNNTYNLGLTRISGNFYAITGLELIKKKLEESGINYSSHIVAMTSDGAVLMKKTWQNSTL